MIMTTKSHISRGIYLFGNTEYALSLTGNTPTFSSTDVVKTAFSFGRSLMVLGRDGRGVLSIVNEYTRRGQGAGMSVALYGEEAASDALEYLRNSENLLPDFILLDTGVEHTGEIISEALSRNMGR